MPFHTSSIAINYMHHNTNSPINTLHRIWSKQWHFVLTKWVLTSFRLVVFTYTTLLSYRRHRLYRIIICWLFHSELYTFKHTHIHRPLFTSFSHCVSLSLYLYLSLTHNQYLIWKKNCCCHSFCVLLLLMLIVFNKFGININRCPVLRGLLIMNGLVMLKFNLEPI